MYFPVNFLSYHIRVLKWVCKPKGAIRVHPAIQVAGKTTILRNASAAGGSTGRHFEDLPDPSLAFLNSSLRCAHSASMYREREKFC